MADHIGIIIPAYKPDFFFEALQSIEKQTDKRFQVYIGDDASPHDLWSIAREFVERNGWIYHRFDENLGAQNLVAHWNRCVEISTEHWIWLFSDDDKMSPDCVETFFSEKEKSPDHQVFKFPYAMIDQQGNVTGIQEIHQEKYSGFEFGKLRFQRKILSAAVEFIFSRQSWQSESGFVPFPAAWCSDDASWIAFSGLCGIRALPSGRVFWRLSEVNISSRSGIYIDQKLQAASDFILWFNERFRLLPERKSLLGEQIIWFRLQIEQLNYEIPLFKALMFSWKLGRGALPSLLRIFNELYFRSFTSMLDKKGEDFSCLWKWKISRFLPRF